MNIIDRLRPDAAERAALQARVDRLLIGAQAVLDEAGLAGEATVQGSIAKDTWIRGNMDVDLFLLLDPAVETERLPAITQCVADAVLEDAQAMYAQHPYLIGRFDGLQVDLVPAYRVSEAGAHMSAVDRTPFHTAWVRAHLDEVQRDDVRLTKQWMKGVGVYGAETSIAGFSGYLVEVLVAAHGSFDAVIDWLAADAHPRRIAVAADAIEEPSLLTIADPVDAARNCAAAVGEATLQRAIEAARAYRDAPDERFFFPDPPNTAAPEELHAALAADGSSWVGVLLPGVERIDIVFPQFQKAATRIAEAWQRAGFTVRATHAWTDDDQVGLQWRLDAAPLPPTRIHRGPPDQGPHAKRFRDKWAGHPDAPDGCRVEDGRLAVEVIVRHRTPVAWWGANHSQVPLGKHVDRVMPEGRWYTDPAEVDSAWSPVVTDFILERRPWQR